MGATSTIPPGGTLQLVANVTNDPSGRGVTWSVSCPSAPCGTIAPATTATGATTTYTAPDVALGSDLSVTVTAASLADALITSSVPVDVSGVNISINPQSATVNIGTTSQFAATVNNDPTNQGVTWSVSCSPTPCGSVSPTTTLNGVATTYTAPTTFPAGDLSVTLTATSVAANAVMNSVSITVPGTTVTVNPSSATLEAASSSPFSADVVNDPNNLGVNWSVSCSPAPCGTVAPTASASGASVTYTAPPTAPESDLPVTLNATSVFNTAVTGSALITVPAITISLSAPSALIPVNIAQTFTSTIANDPTNAGVNWTLTQNSAACTAACGTVSPGTTPSGTATTYTAPNAVPPNGPVTLTATSVFDNTKSSSATITISTGTVMLVPASINFGTRLVNSTSPVHTIVLTNTGTSALTVSTITFTGTNTGDFALSPASPCGNSVAAGSTCNIGITFTPKARGNRTANLSIADSSTDSPQIVSLTGLGVQICSAQIKQTLSAKPTRAALTTFGAATVPAPTGNYSVGMREMRLVDTARQDPFLENGSNRELMVRFWYPTKLETACTPAEYTPHAVWSYFSQLMHMPLPAVTTNSCLDAPIAEGAHPIVVFTHGYTGTFTDYTFLFEDLASRGYVVASVDHTYEATAVQFPDGRFVHSGFGSHLGNKMIEDDDSLAFALSVRLDDLRFVADELQRLNRTLSSPFRGKLDVNRMAIAGHSMGGLAASLVSDRDARFKAGIIIDVHDGNVPDAVVGATRTPVFIFASGRDQWTENECRLWNNLHGPRLAINLEGSEHLTPTDAVWLAKGAVKTGTMGPDKAIAAVRDYIAAFLDVHLQEKTFDPLLSGSSLRYPDAFVVTAEKSLCSKGAQPSSPSGKSH
jgi:predicted dienelactone hydrolase